MPLSEPAKVGQPGRVFYDAPGIFDLKTGDEAMNIVHIDQAPLGALVKARRTARCVEPCTMWGIKAALGKDSSPDYHVGIFWLGSDSGHPGFETAFDEKVCQLAESLRLTCDLDSIEVWDSMNEAVEAARLGLYVTDAPYFVGELIKPNTGESGGVCTCTLDGQVRRYHAERSLDQPAAAVGSVTIAPSEGPEFGWLNDLDGAHNPF